jgi:hypothetical protein
MKRLLFLLVLGLYSCNNTVTPPYYIIRVGDNVFYTKNVIEINNGVKFYSVNAKDTIEVHGTYTKRYIRPQIKEINHNNYTK